MRGPKKSAMAVRKPDGSLYEEVWDNKPSTIWNRIPIVRGVVNMVISLVSGYRCLMKSAEISTEGMGEEEEPSRFEQWLDRVFGEKLEAALMSLVMVISVVLAIVIFMVFPMLLSRVLHPLIPSETVMAILEGILRILIFICYIKLISRMEDIRRTFMYHGAEHKCINCIEHGMELNVENVRRSSKEHKRCGTSFLLIVMVISILFFMVIRVDNLWLRIVSRIVLIPVIAGVSYEFLRLAGRSESRLVNLLSRPGLWMQGLTTSEPDDSMIEVAIRAVETVFDWRAYLAENFPETAVSEGAEAASCKAKMEEAAG